MVSAGRARIKHLITGGAGFIGSALARRLVSRGDTVVVLDRFSRGKRDRLPREVETIWGDIRDYGLVCRAVLGSDVVWHLAYVQGTQTFYAQPKEVIDVALRGISNVLRACEVAGPAFFLVSSSEVYQTPPVYPTNETVPLSVPDVMNPRCSYGGGKIASEIATMAYAEALARAVIVRPHNIYGPDAGEDHVIPQFALRMQEPGRGFPIQGTGEETRSFCYIDDCVDGFMALLERGETGVYHLGNPDAEISMGDLALRVAEWYGREIEVVPSELPKGSPTRRLPDIGKLAALGYRPRVSLAEGLALTLSWYARN